MLINEMKHFFLIGHGVQQLSEVNSFGLAFRRQ